MANSKLSAQGADIRVSNKLSSAPCPKNPGHDQFTPIDLLSENHLLWPFRSRLWVDIIKLKGHETVRLVTRYTSHGRTEDLGYDKLKGTTTERVGSGTAFVMNMGRREFCREENCQRGTGTHQISGVFKVMTAAHIVFDDDEAAATTVEFFFDDDDDDRSGVILGQGIRVSQVDVQKNYAVFECRTHDLSLFGKLEKYRKQREELVKKLPSEAPVNGSTNGANCPEMVVCIAHPHGLAKHVSIGELKKVYEEGEVRWTRDNIALIGCVLTYTTPTCVGTGGGSINRFGLGKGSVGFAPHCASRSEGENISGLGWTLKNGVNNHYANGH